MANLNETGAEAYNWDESGIYQLETTDPVQAGAGGISNRQATELAARTRNLHDRLVARELWNLQTIRGDISEDLDTLEKLREHFVGLINDIEVGNIDIQAVLQEIRGGIDESMNTLEKLRAVLVARDLDWAKLINVPEYKGRAALSTAMINWAGKPEIYKTIAANTEFDAENLEEGKTIGLLLDGAFEATFTVKFKKIAGSPVPSPTELNYIQMKCLNATAGSELIIYSVMYLEV